MSDRKHGDGIWVNNPSKIDWSANKGTTSTGRKTQSIETVKAITELPPAVAHISAAYAGYTTVVSRKQFTDFINDLGFKESSNNYGNNNNPPYLGRYQFGPFALEDIGFKDSSRNWTSLANNLGVYSDKDFLNNPAVQDQAMNLYLKKNWEYAINYGLDNYIGSTMNGVVITESGLLAAMHLVGVGAVRNAIRKGDLASEKDGNGTTALSYMVRFGGYNVDQITKKP